MANNRLYLLHRPTKTTILLAKRMADGWYIPCPTINSEEARGWVEFINGFFDYTVEEGPYEGMDDFELLIEDADNGSKLVIRDDWSYDDFEFYGKKLIDNPDMQIIQKGISKDNEN